MDALRSIAKRQSNGDYEFMELFIQNLEKAGVSRAAQLVELCEDGIEQLLSGVFPDMLPVEYPQGVLVILRDWAGTLPKIADMEFRRGRSSTSLCLDDAAWYYADLKRKAAAARRSDPPSEVEGPRGSSSSPAAHGDVEAPPWTP